MQDPIIDRTLAILADAGRVALPLAAIARELGYRDPAALEPRLADDDRLVLVHGGPFPPVAPDPLGRDEAYAAALRSAGLARVTLVARTRVSPAAPAVDALLCASIAPLVASPGAAGLVAAAARAQDAVREATAGEGGPSTTPPPGPPPPGPAWPPPRRP